MRCYGKADGFHNPQRRKDKLPPQVFAKAAHLQNEENMKRSQAIAVAASLITDVGN